MTNLMIRVATLATCSIALIAAFSVTPVVAVGSDPGGGEANYGGIGREPRPLTPPRPRKPSSPFSTTPPSLMGTAQLIRRSTIAMTMPLRLNS
jgi:hypothetical protein